MAIGILFNRSFVIEVVRAETFIASIIGVNLLTFTELFSFKLASSQFVNIIVWFEYRGTVQSNVCLDF